MISNKKIETPGDAYFISQRRHLGKDQGRGENDDLKGQSCVVGSCVGRSYRQKAGI
jgi:hypothetical protein